MSFALTKSTSSRGDTKTLESKPMVTLGLEQEFMLGVTSSEQFPSVHFNFLSSCSNNHDYGDDDHDYEHLKHVRLCYVSGQTVVIERVALEDESNVVAQRHQSFISCNAVITAIRVNSSRNLIAVAEMGGVVNIYDAVTLRRRKVLGNISNSSKEYVRDISFSGDSKYCVILATSSNSNSSLVADYVCTFWSIEKNTHVVSTTSVVNPCGKPIHRVSISPLDSSLVFISGGGGMLRMLRVVDAHFRNITLSDSNTNVARENFDFLCHQWLPAENSVFLGADNECISMVSSLEVKNCFQSTSVNKIMSIVATPSGLFIGLSSGSIDFYEFMTDRGSETFYPPRHIAKLDASIIAMDLTSSGFLGFETSNHEILFLLVRHDNRSYNVKTELQHLVTNFISSGAAKITSLDIASCKPYIIMCHNKRLLRLWDYSSKSLVFSSELAFDALALSIHPNGLRFALATSKQLKIFSILIDLPMQMLLELDASDLQAIQFSNGGHLIAFVDDGQMMIRDTRTFSLVRSMRGLKSTCKSICWEENDNSVCIIGIDGSFLILGVHEGTRLVDQGAPLSKHLLSGTVSSDFKKLFLIGCNNSLVEYNLKNMASELFEEQRAEQVACIENFMFLTCSGSIIVFDNHHKKIQHLSCHTETITAMRCNESFLFTYSSDGSLSMFRLVSSTKTSVRSHLPINEYLVSTPYLDEKENCLKALHDEIERVRYEKDVELRRLDLDTEVLIHQQNLKCKQMLEGKEQECRDLESSKAEIELKFSNEQQVLKDNHLAEMERINTTFFEKRANEEKRLNKLKSKEVELSDISEKDHRNLVNHHAIEIQHISDDFNNLIETELDKQAILRATRKTLISKFNIKNNAIERDGDEKYIERRGGFETKLYARRQSTKQLNEECEIVKIKFDEIRKDSNELNNSILRYKGKETELQTEYKQLMDTKEKIHKSLNERDKTIAELDLTTQEATSRDLKLERLRYSLDEELQQLRQRLEPFEKNASNLNRQLHQSNAIFIQEEKEHNIIKLTLTGVADKLKALKRELIVQDRLIKSKKSFTKSRLLRVNDLRTKKDYISLKAAVVDLYKSHNQNNVLLSNESINEASAIKLMKEVEDLKRKLCKANDICEKEQTSHEMDYKRLAKQNAILKRELKSLQQETHNHQHTAAT